MVFNKFNYSIDNKCRVIENVIISVNEVHESFPVKVLFTSDEVQVSMQYAKKCLLRISFASRKHPGVLISPCIISNG